MNFYPMVVEPSGGWGPTALRVFRKLARGGGSRGGGVGPLDLADGELSLHLRMRQRFCVLVRRQCARGFLRRLGAGRDLPEDEDNTLDAMANKRRMPP